LFIFLNIQLQNQFYFLSLDDIYAFYSQQFICIFYAAFLIIFSNNLFVTNILYAVLVFSSLLLLHNPDLKDIKNKYSHVFVSGMVACVFLFVGIVFMYFFEKKSTFVVLENNFQYLVYILLPVLLYNFIYPIHSLFKEKVFYEDLVPLSIIVFVPYCVVNIFLFTKTVVFILGENLEKIHIIYSGYFLILLFLVTLYFLIKNFKFNRKFILLYNILSFLTFLTQFSLVRNSTEMLHFYTNFVFFVLIFFLNVLASSSMVFFMFILKAQEMSAVYRMYKKEIRFYLFSLLLTVMFLSMSFFDANMYFFNLMYLLNLIQIFIVLIVFLVHLYFCIYKRPIKLMETKSKAMLPRIFLPTFVYFLILLLLLMFRTMFFSFLS
jgi:hypothetical protein